MGRHSPEPKPSWAHIYRWLGAFAVLLLIGIGLTWHAQAPTSALATGNPTVAAPHRTETVARRETRPTLDPARFVGKARLALRAYPDATTAGHALIPMVALSLLFTVAAIVLLSLPMGMRHDM